MRVVTDSPSSVAWCWAKSANKSRSVLWKQNYHQHLSDWDAVIRNWDLRAQLKIIVIFNKCVHVKIISWGKTKQWREANSRDWVCRTCVLWRGSGALSHRSGPPGLWKRRLPWKTLAKRAHDLSSHLQLRALITASSPQCLPEQNHLC